MAGAPEKSGAPSRSCAKNPGAITKKINILAFRAINFHVFPYPIDKLLFIL